MKWDIVKNLILNTLIERLKPYGDRDETIAAQYEVIELQKGRIEMLEDLSRSLESQITSHKSLFERLWCPLDKMLDALETTGRFEPENDLPVLTMTQTLH